MTRYRSILAGTCLIASGAVLGPPVIALAHAVGVALTEHDATGGPDRPAAANSNARASYLLQVYQPHRPPARPGILFVDVEPVPWAECGHRDLERRLRASPDGGPTSGTSYADQSAALGSALMLAAHHEQDVAAVATLARSTSTFSATLLADCIEGTLLRPLCVAHVTTLLGGAPLRPPRELPESRSIRCTFYDGVAARTDVPPPAPR